MDRIKGLDIHTDSWLAPGYGCNDCCLGNVTIAGRGPIGTLRISNPHYVGARPRTALSLQAEAEEDAAIRAHNECADENQRELERERQSGRPITINRNVGRQDDFDPVTGRWV